MPTEIINCPKCGKKVEHKTHEGIDFGIFEEVPATPIEKKVEARLGLPFRHMIPHKCEEGQVIPPISDSQRAQADTKKIKYDKSRRGMKS